MKCKNCGTQLLAVEKYQEWNRKYPNHKIWEYACPNPKCGDVNKLLQSTKK